MEATVKAYPPPRCTFYINGQPIVPTPRRNIVREKDTIILIIINAQKEDEGDYQLNVENEVGSVTCKTTLTMARKWIMWRFFQGYAVKILEKYDDSAYL